MNNILKKTLIHAGVGIGVGTVIGIAREVKPMISEYKASQHVAKQNLKHAAIRTAKLAAITGGIGAISGAISGSFAKLKLEAAECNLEDFGIDPNTLI